MPRDNFSGELFVSYQTETPAPYLNYFCPFADFPSFPSRPCTVMRRIAVGMAGCSEAVTGVFLSIVAFLLVYFFPSLVPQQLLPTLSPSAAHRTLTRHKSERKKPPDSPSLQPSFENLPIRPDHDVPFIVPTTPKSGCRPCLTTRRSLLTTIEELPQGGASRKPSVFTLSLSLPPSPTVKELQNSLVFAQSAKQSRGSANNSSLESKGVPQTRLKLVKSKSVRRLPEVERIEPLRRNVSSPLINEKSKKYSKRAADRTNPYESPYFFPSPAHPDVNGYVASLQREIKLAMSARSSPNGAPPASGRSQSGTVATVTWKRYLGVGSGKKTYKRTRQS
ncbi:hypothetical protein K488DRAFT_86133 [Vararia minispora EC-137]|uniref:Uncharacterized protein n=1 Tax=Vararia minispora EC-137 TaxID=1314806 RepID=A0ACB8QKK4_9AGAM|nr:hypothetical protein K488DRAFT_86133 [Vararia minispora EC-137]